MRRQLALSLVSLGCYATGLAGQQAKPDWDEATVAVSGEGAPTYVLLSGIVGGVAGLNRLRAELVSGGARVIVIDPYRLSLDSTDVSFAALARRVVAVLDRYGDDPVGLAGHAHGGGVALRVAAYAPERVFALYLLDVGALPYNRTKVFSTAYRLAPLLARIPFGRRFIRARFLNGLAENSGTREWLDSTTRHAYSEPMLNHIGAVVAMAARLADSVEPEPLPTVVARLRGPVLAILGEWPHPSGPDPEELTALEPLGAAFSVARLPGVGHFPHEESPDSVARLILACPGSRTTGASGSIGQDAAAGRHNNSATFAANCTWP